MICNNYPPVLHAEHHCYRLPSQITTTKWRKRREKNENARANIEPYMETETNNKQGPNACMEIAIHTPLYSDDFTSNFLLFHFSRFGSTRWWTLNSTVVPRQRVGCTALEQFEIFNLVSHIKWSLGYSQFPRKIKATSSVLSNILGETRCNVTLLILPFRFRIYPFSLVLTGASREGQLSYNIFSPSNIRISFGETVSSCECVNMVRF